MIKDLQTIDYVDQNTIVNHNVLEKYRVQVPIIVLVTALIQYLVAFAFIGIQPLPAIIANSIFLSFVTNIAGLFFYRRMRLYPGTRRLAFILPSFALAWAGVACVLIFARIPYSTIQMAAGLISALTVALALNAWNRKSNINPFVVIPSSRVSSLLSELPNLRYTVCKNAQDIAAADMPIIADLHADLPQDWNQALAKATLRGVSIYHIKQIGESLTGRVQVNHLSENALGSLEPNTSYAFLKAVIERLLSAITLLLCLPILLLTVFAIRLESKGPAIFRQTRVGYRGKKFTIYKLRTMVYDTGLRSHTDDITLENDGRITKFGKFLRASRIDEIPQLYNVVRGEMSLIGPRPETEKLSHWYEESIDFYAYRHVVLPGITGWAQVKQGHVASQQDVKLKLQYDFYYIKNYSLWLDVVIALKTIKVMALKIGAK
jgi:lipopolysaccharide/colanic/teichoic acid biosynthesis glycosyltransferase